MPVRPLVAAAQRQARDHVGMVGAAIVADEEALVEIRARGLVHGGGALDALVRREVADIVLVYRQAPLVVHRHGVELARGLEGRVDDLLRHAVAGEVEEADLLARAPHLRGHGLEPAGIPRNAGPKSMTGMARVASSRSFTAMLLKMFIGWLLLAGDVSIPRGPRSCTDFAAPGLPGRRSNCDPPSSTATLGAPSLTGWLPLDPRRPPGARRIR